MKRSIATHTIEAETGVAFHCLDDKNYLKTSAVSYLQGNLLKSTWP